RRGRVLLERAFPPWRLPVVRPVVQRHAGEHHRLIAEADGDQGSAERRGAVSAPGPAPAGAPVAAVRIPDAAELAAVFVPARGDELVEQPWLVRVGVGDLTREGLGDAVDDQEVPAVLADPAAAAPIRAAERLEVGPDAGGVATDHDPAAPILAGDRGHREDVTAETGHHVLKRHIGRAPSARAGPAAPS